MATSTHKLPSLPMARWPLELVAIYRWAAAIGLFTWAMWDSSYGGVTTINEGYITISSAQGLGSSAGGTTVAPGAMLWVTPGTQVNNEALTLAGTGTSKHYGALNMNSNSSWG